MVEKVKVIQLVGGVDNKRHEHRCFPSRSDGCEFCAMQEGCVDILHRGN